MLFLTFVYNTTASSSFFCTYLYTFLGLTNKIYNRRTIRDKFVSYKKIYFTNHIL